MNKKRKTILNPIESKLRDLIDQCGFTKEKISVRAEIPFTTLNNVFSHKPVSERVILALKHRPEISPGKYGIPIITEADEKEYRKWISENPWFINDFKKEAKMRIKQKKDKNGSCKKRSRGTPKPVKRH